MSLEKVSGATLTVTHIIDGEEIITGGEDGQVWVATFACPEAARRYLERARNEIVWGERLTPPKAAPIVPAGTRDDLLEIPRFLRSGND